jgi:methionyl-tRNA formyltransferase
MGKDLLVESLPALLERRAAREKQPQDSPTPMARLVPQGEILKQVRWESWTAEHAWHFLNGVVCEWRPSEDRPDEFRGLPALWRGFVWEFSDWSRDRVNAAPGAIVWAHKRWCVACSDGVVHFRRRFSWRRFLGR